MKARSLWLRALAGAAFIVMSAAALARQFPERTIRWIVPYPPGGSTDIPTQLVIGRIQISSGARRG